MPGEQVEVGAFPSGPAFVATLMVNGQTYELTAVSSTTASTSTELRCPNRQVSGCSASASFTMGARRWRQHA
jgi:hypothetical protein